MRSDGNVLSNRDYDWGLKRAAFRKKKGKSKKKGEGKRTKKRK